MGEMVRSGIGAVLTSRGGPVVLALILALVSLPFTAGSLQLAPYACSSDWCGAGDGMLRVDDAYLAGLGSVLLGALFGGGLAGFAVRRQPLGGALLAIALAWPAAIGGLTVLPGLVGHPMAIGNAGIDNYQAAISIGGRIEVGGLAAYLTSVLASYGNLLAVPVSIVGLVLAAIKRANLRPIAFLFGLVALVAMNMWSILNSGSIYLILVVGVLIWARILSSARYAPTVRDDRPPGVARSVVPPGAGSAESAGWTPGQMVGDRSNRDA
jgi:hypothetical protein